MRTLLPNQNKLTLYLKMSQIFFSLFVKLLPNYVEDVKVLPDQRKKESNREQLSNRRFKTNIPPNGKGELSKNIFYSIRQAGFLAPSTAKRHLVVTQALSRQDPKIGRYFIFEELCNKVFLLCFQISRKVNNKFVFFKQKWA